MQHEFGPRRLLAPLMLLGALAFPFVSPRSTSAGDGPSISIESEKNIDERLFLIRALENTYAQWPTATTDPKLLFNWIKGTRLRMVRLGKHAEVGGEVDPHIITLYKECLALLDEYERFLYNVGALGRATADVKDIGKIGLDAVGRGYAVGQFALTNPLGYTVAPYALGTGLVVASGSAVYDLWTRGNQEAALTQARKEQLDDWANQINTHFESTHAGAEVAVKRLAQKYSWGTAAGFDGTIKRRGPEQVRARPADPFAIVLASGSGNDKDAAELAVRSERCLAAARLVPPGEVYDPFRSEFVAAAARLCLMAVGAEVESKLDGKPTYTGHRSPLAPRAVELHQLYLRLQPDDPGKVGHRELARALAFAGRFTEALSAARDASSEWNQDAFFAYRLAKLSCLNGEHDLALESLQKAMGLGFKEVALTHVDSDLAPLRAARPDAFRELTEVKWSWSIGWAVVFQDEVTLTNDSAFPMSDIELTAVVESPDGGKSWTEILQGQELWPGKTLTWKIPNPGITYRGSDYVSRARLTCAQIPKVASGSSPGVVPRGNGDFPSTTKSNEGRRIGED